MKKIDSNKNFSNMVAPLIIISIYFNMIIGVVDRVLQIVYYILSKTNKLFVTDTADHIALTFIILPFGFNFILILIYTIFHHEERLTVCNKIKSFFLYLLSTEILYPIGIQKSFITKYSESSDNPVVSMKLLNFTHVMFISLPQILIISVNSSANESFEKIDIASLVFSSLFMVWSCGYLALCSVAENQYDDYISSNVYKY